MGKVTVNGAPVEHYIGEQQGHEIAKHRESEVRELSFARPLVSRQHRNHSKKRTAPGQVVYQAWQRETHVLIAGMEFPWHAKAPYVSSGESVLGGIELDKSADLVKCHECGSWTRSIGHHVRAAHAPLTAKQYRFRHGLRSNRQLTSPGLHSAESNNPKIRTLRKGGVGHFTGTSNPMHVALNNMVLRQARGLGLALSPETMNLRRQCKKQITQAMRELSARFKRTPTTKEMAAVGLFNNRIAQIFGMSYMEAVREMGLTPLVPRRKASLQVVNG